MVILLPLVNILKFRERHFCQIKLIKYLVIFFAADLYNIIICSVRHGANRPYGEKGNDGVIDEFSLTGEHYRTSLSSSPQPVRS